MLYPHKVTRIENFKIAFDDAPIAGYVVECGVGRGKSLNQLVRLSKQRLVFGFDSCQGLPEDWKMSDKWTWPEGSFAQDAVPEILGADIRVGWFVDTLPVWKKEHPGRIALLHIDCDLYSSTVTILEELNDQIIPGTVIISDDHFYKQASGIYGKEYVNWEQGSYKAFNEWLEKYDRKVYLLSQGILGQATYRILK